MAGGARTTPGSGRTASGRPRAPRTAAARDASVAAPGGVCRPCPTVPPEHVGHRHETGRVRGVLCFSCTAALGQFKERPDAVRRAAAYVEGIAWKRTLVAPGVCQLPS
ncbi:endonuclease domain-containing protein [Streptomyces thermodiastaticus]|uniref:endonuclease domain-containing protein n=1 Tax=Streptomyces thermodiastaticus TaxID=44061 RepID=UPI00167B514B|nr:endonuclease domain-containing protein [Streptomyces thermodiastaticus]